MSIHVDYLIAAIYDTMKPAYIKIVLVSIDRNVLCKI